MALSRAHGVATVLLLSSVVLDGQPRVTTLGVPDRSNAHVSMASADRFVAVVWSARADGGATDIYAAVSRDSGRRFSTPTRVNSTPGDAQVGGEQPPRVALRPRPSAEPEIGVLWTSKGNAGTTLLFATSADGGRSFGRSSAVIGDAPGNRGWQALAHDGRDFLAVWLDHERLAAGTAVAGGAHQHQAGGSPSRPAADKPDGVAMAQMSDLRFQALSGGRAARAVTGGVCYCCKTALAAAGGALFTAWRHVYPGNIRDIAFAVSRDGGQTFSVPVRVSEDHWELAGCPDDGPAMAVASDGRIHIVWPTAVTDRGQLTKALFHASSADGLRFTPRRRIPTDGVANHPQIAIAPEGGLVVVWDESGGGSRRVAAARGTVEADGQVRFVPQPVGSAERAVYPAVTATPEGVLLSWTATTAPAIPNSTSTIAVARLP
jgi:hypothetical protein